MSYIAPDTDIYLLANVECDKSYDNVKYFKIIVIFTYDLPIFATQNLTIFINTYETNT